MPGRLNASLQRGVGLIEILVTLIVLGFGLLSLAKLQGAVLQDGSVAKARTVAAHLAQQKIEDLRDFQVILPPVAAPAGVTAYSAIGTNVGGPIPSGNITVSAVQYNRTWIVQNWYYTGTNSAAVAVAPMPLPAFPDFKKITVVVTWDDQDGQPQSVTLNTVISSADPRRSGRAFLF